MPFAIGQIVKLTPEPPTRKGGRPRDRTGVIIEFKGDFALVDVAKEAKRLVHLSVLERLKQASDLRFR